MQDNTTHLKIFRPKFTHFENKIKLCNTLFKVRSLSLPTNLNDNMSYGATVGAKQDEKLSLSTCLKIA